MANITLSNYRPAEILANNALTLPVQTAQPVAVSGSNGSFFYSTLSMGNANGLSLYTTNGSVVGSYTVPTSAGIYIGGNTTGQSSSSTYPITSLNVSGIGIISAGWSNSTLIISAPDTTGLTQLSAGFSTFGNTAGNTGLASAQLVLVGSNNITLSGSTNGGSQTISIIGAAGGGGGGGGVNFGVSTFGNTAGATGTVTTGNVILVGSGPISLSQATGAAGSAATITINAPAISSLVATGIASLSSNGSTISIGAAVPLLSRTDFGLSANSTSVLTQGSASFKYVQVAQPITFSRIDIPVLISLATAGNANTADLNFSSGLVIYSRNGSTLSPIIGSLGSTTLTWASNSSSYSGITGGKNISFQLNGSLSPGEYWIGFQLSTTNNSSIGTATTLLGNTISMFGGVSYSASQIGDFGNTYSQSQNIITQGLFSNTITATNQTIALSNISATGAAAQNVLFPIVLRNY